MHTLKIWGLGLSKTRTLLTKLKKEKVKSNFINSDIPHLEVTAPLVIWEHLLTELDKACCVVSTNEKGKPVHGSEPFTYLGTVGWRGKIYDLYFVDGDYPSVIARFGEGNDYLSGLDFADRCYPLGEARDRAVEMGLIKKTYKSL